MISDLEHWRQERRDAAASRVGGSFWIRPALDEVRAILESYDHEASIDERTAVVGEARSILARCLDELAREARDLQEDEQGRRERSRRA